MPWLQLDLGQVRILPGWPRFTKGDTIWEFISRVGGPTPAAVATLTAIVFASIAGVGIPVSCRSGPNGAHREPSKDRAVIANDVGGDGLAVATDQVTSNQTLHVPQAITPGCAADSASPLGSPERRRRCRTSPSCQEPASPSHQPGWPRCQPPMTADPR